MDHAAGGMFSRWRVATDMGGDLLTGFVLKGKPLTPREHHVKVSLHFYWARGLFVSN